MNAYTLASISKQFPLLTDKSVIEFTELFEVVRGGYKCDELFEKQTEIVENVNLCLVNFDSFIGDLSDFEGMLLDNILKTRIAKQVEMEYTVKYAGIVPHVANKIELGAVLYSSWGYDQTNVDYYCVVEMTKSMCKLLPLCGEMVEALCSMSEMVTATKTIDFSGELLRKKIQFSQYNEGGYVTIASYASARLWDGKEKYQSHYH